MVPDASRFRVLACCVVASMAALMELLPQVCSARSIT